jgi:putative transposase
VQKSEDFHRRKNLRLEGYDYSQGGIYHVVIVTKDRALVFGHIENNNFIPNRLGDRIIDVLTNFSSFHKEIEIELFQVMPNHLHLLISIQETKDKPLGYFVRALKTFTSKMYRDWLEINGHSESSLNLWQRGYNDHVIRDEKDHEITWLYIESNPVNWMKDEEITLDQLKVMS